MTAWKTPGEWELEAALAASERASSRERTIADDLHEGFARFAIDVQSITMEFVTACARLGDALAQTRRTGDTR